MNFLNNKLIGARLKNLRGNLSSRAFALGAGLDPSQYSKIEKGILSLSETALKKLSKTYGFDEHMLLFGEDNRKQLISVLKEKGNSYADEGVNPQKNEITMIPLVAIADQRQYAKNPGDAKFTESLPHYALLPGIDHRGAIWRYFEMPDNSLKELFRKKQIILTSLVHSEEWAEAAGSENIFIIIGNNRLFVSRLKVKLSSSEKILALVSLKGRNQLKELKFSEITELWKYRRHIANDASRK